MQPPADDGGGQPPLLLLQPPPRVGELAPPLNQPLPKTPESLPNAIPQSETQLPAPAAQAGPPAEAAARPRVVSRGRSPPPRATDEGWPVPVGPPRAPSPPPLVPAGALPPLRARSPSVVSVHRTPRTCSHGLADFGEALQALARVHHQEVRALHSELQGLRKQLSEITGDGKATLAPRPESEETQMPKWIGISLEQPVSNTSTVVDSLRRGGEAPPTTVATQEVPPRTLIKRSRTVNQSELLDFPPRHVWQGKISKLEKQISTSRRFSFATAMEKSLTHEELVVKGTSCLQPFIVHPSSISRLVWDLCCMLFLAYDIVAIPFVSAFQCEETDSSGFLIVMTWFTMVFWSIDVFASVLTGYPEGKRVVLDPWRVLMRYLRTWFLLDAVLISLDWIYALTVEDLSGGSSARLGRSFRALRFVRTLRLFRLLKLKRIIQELQDHINTEVVAIMFGIVKIITCLVVANHLVACGWYGVGRSGDEDQPSWVEVHKMERRDLSYRYTTSLHWSLTQFTPASMEVFPENSFERLYSVTVLIFAMVCFSSFLSMLVASMMELRKIHNDSSRQFWLLRRYMRDWGVSQNTRMRIQRYLEYAYKRQKQRVQEKDVELLGLLSEPLREEMKYETFSGHLFVHPFFAHCEDRTRLFSSAVSAMSLAKGDFVFCCGTQASRMIFLCNGLLEYCLGELEGVGPTSPSSPSSGGSQTWISAEQHHSFTGCPNPEMVLEGQWVSEAVLWTHWLHLGDLLACQESQIILVDAAKFGEAVSQSRPLLFAVRGYVDKFLQMLNEVEKKDLTDLLHQAFSSQEVIDESNFTLQPSPTHADEEDTDAAGGLHKTAWNALKRRSGWFGTPPPSSG